MAPDINTVKGRLASPTTSSARSKQRARSEYKRSTAVVPTSTKDRRPSSNMDPNYTYYQPSHQPWSCEHGCFDQASCLAYRDSNSAWSYPQYTTTPTTGATVSVAPTYSGGYPTYYGTTSNENYTYGTQYPPTYYPDNTGPSVSEDNPPYFCPDCGKDFVKEDVLKRHQKQHTKPNVCEICDWRTAESRDLHRHLWVHHPQIASQMDIPTIQERCPVSGCGYTGRRDNVARHRRTKHGHT